MKRRFSCLPLVVALVIGACQKHVPEATLMDPAIAKSIEEFKNRRVYQQLTPAILASIPDADVEQVIFDYAASKVGEAYEREREIIVSLAPGVRALYVTRIVEGEIDNGGFNQFYWNSSGQFAPEAAEAFEFFSASRHASLMREANEVHSKELAEIQMLKDKGTLDAFSKSYEVSKLGPLDDRFYKIGEDLSKLRVAKIRSAPELFIGE